MPRDFDLSVEYGDITTFEADVIALKYAGAFHGADDAIAHLLKGAGVALDSLRPQTGRFHLTSSRGVVGAKMVLFIGVPYLRDFGYSEIRSFAGSVMATLCQAAPNVEHVAMTTHGVGYGLDESEALRSVLYGLFDSMRTLRIPRELKRISIVDRNKQRVSRLRMVLDDTLSSVRSARKLPGGSYRLTVEVPADTQAVHPPQSGATNPPLPSGVPETRRHAFVAMPFSVEFEDVFYYGIQTSVHSSGLLCERIDHSAFTGSIVDVMLKKIESAAIVIADLSGGNENVFLEVGYAWGTRRPTILLAHTDTELPFDVRGHKCLLYSSIKQLETTLTNEIMQLSAQKVI